MIAWLALVASAQDVNLDTDRVRPLLGRPVVELRGGLEGAHQWAVPVVCGQVTPLRFLAVEACGTGSGLFHNPDIPEQSHYRVEGLIPLRSSGTMELTLQPGVGFSEVQTGIDQPGFRFGREVAPGQNEAAGVEAAVGLSGRSWVAPRMYVTADVTAGSAYAPAAPEAVGSRSGWLPFALLTVGLGL